MSRLDYSCGSCGYKRKYTSYSIKSAEGWYAVDGTRRQHTCKDCNREACAKARRRKWLEYKLAEIKAKCLRDNIEFNLFIDDLDVPNFCPALGIPLGRRKGYSDHTPSFDRINPLRGYTKDNVVIVSWRANRAKSNLSPTELLALAVFYHGFE